MHHSINGAFALSHPPQTWQRLGRIIERGMAGEFDASVTGDPCIVWDEAHERYRMFYFAQKHVDGREVNAVGQALARSALDIGAGAWYKLGPLAYVNPDALLGGAHKPWLLMDAYRPNVAVRLDGQYRLFVVSWRGSTKVIQMATAPSLDGPWQVQRQPVLDVGSGDAFDAYHVDTVTAFWFEARQQILLFYKGYPVLAQPDQPRSPYGSGSAAAVMSPGDTVAHKLGKVLAPSSLPGHWAGGWIGGLQIVPARRGGWYALLNASPTPPPSPELSPIVREPAPSLGGWAYTAEEWPVGGWQMLARPIEWIEDIPESARQNGEGVNMWRHHLVVSDNKLYLFYNSGPYGQERMFGRCSDKEPAVT